MLSRSLNEVIRKRECRRRLFRLLLLAPTTKVERRACEASIAKLACKLVAMPFKHVERVIALGCQHYSYRIPLMSNLELHMSEVVGGERQFNLSVCRRRHMSQQLVVQICRCCNLGFEMWRVRL